MSVKLFRGQSVNLSSGVVTGGPQGRARATQAERTARIERIWADNTLSVLHAAIGYHTRKARA